MVDFIERGLQVCVKHPVPFRAFRRDGLVDHLDRVMASAARPETVLLLVQPGLPFGFQRTAHPLLLGTVGDNGNSERALFSAFLGYVHPPHRERPAGSALAVQSHRQGRPVLGGQGDLPVDSGGAAAGISLRDPAYADQRVSPAAQQQFLQVANLFAVAFLLRLEDPLL
jgi:hypothetical protein